MDKTGRINSSFINDGKSVGYEQNKFALRYESEPLVLASELSTNPQVGLRDDYFKRLCGIVC
jgi:hypothetical protein